ncbi:hypothetical protein B296_00045031 [Ensete ventricosum]|uniref:Uncharacterized protein n=1 Tax=Ensete ventricosum TaxID=4639 RepID=A0A426XSE0_ENSVE|nr:hypothetical protein B296_00045031 [Ensete ventricosum]
MLRSDAGADLVVTSLRQHRVLQVVPCCLSPPLLLLLPPQPLLPDLAAGHRRKDASFLCSLPAGGRSLRKTDDVNGRMVGVIPEGAHQTHTAWHDQNPPR